jgi:vacuolar protein sorting-associated protein 13A/C
LKQFYKLIGAVDIIGNPIGLFKNISTGLADFVDKPAEGLVKGPLELGRGIAEGGYSLVAHTIGGALYSLDKMTGALSTGLAFLCLDP